MIDFLSVQQQIPGSDSVASPAETLPDPSLTVFSPPSGRHFPVLRDFEEDVLFPSPAENFVPSPGSRDVSSAVRRELLIDVYLVGGCSPHSFTSFPDKIPSRVLL